MRGARVNLNVACGNVLAPGFENSDINGETGVTHLDLHQFPYPYDDESAEIVMMSHGIFMAPGDQMLHPELERMLAEFHRILVSGGWLRIDDSPKRCYALPDAGSDYDNGYPPELRMPRPDFIEIIRAAGFRLVEEVPNDQTWIDADDETLEAVIANSHLHASFTVEAQK